MGKVYPACPAWFFISQVDAGGDSSLFSRFASMEKMAAWADGFILHHVFLFAGFLFESGRIFISFL
jgi:hypothetical protein